MIGRLLLGAACAVLAGCANLDQPYVQKRYWVIEAVRPESAAAEAGIPLLLVPLRPTPVSDQTGFVYRRIDGGWESDFYNEFFVPPGQLVSRSLAQWISDAGLFGPVVDAASQVDADWLLEGALTDLHVDWEAGEPTAVVGLELFLIDRRAPGERLRLHGAWSARQPADGREPADLVRAWNAALAEVLATFEADLRTVAPEE